MLSVPYDPCVGAREGRDDVAGSVAGHAAVAVLTGLAVDLKAGLGEGEDPVLGGSRTARTGAA